MKKTVVFLQPFPCSLSKFVDSCLPSTVVLSSAISFLVTAVTSMPRDAYDKQSGHDKVESSIRSRRFASLVGRFTMIFTAVVFFRDPCPLDLHTHTAKWLANFLKDQFNAVPSGS